MRRIQIEWDDGSIEHIKGHNVEPEEVEEVLEARHLFERGRRGKYYALGQTAAGRYLFIVLSPRRMGFYSVVTARDMSANERKRFRRKVR